MRENPGIRERRIEVAGVPTRVLENDPPADLPRAPAIMLLHGYCDSADTWRPVLGLLAQRGLRAVALDLPGFGQAGRLDRDQPILPQIDAFLAHAVEAEASESPDGEVVIVGNSLGGCGALRAAQDPELPIVGVVPVAPAGLDAMAGWFPIIEGAPLVQALLRAPVPLPEFAVREAVGRVYRMLAFNRPGDVDPEAVAAFTRHVRSRRDVVRILGTGHRIHAEIQEPFRLDRIECPVLVIWGDSDRMVYTSGADKILREVDGSRLEVIETCGHCPQLEAPERLTELVADFATSAVAA